MSDIQLGTFQVSSSSMEQLDYQILDMRDYGDVFGGILLLSPYVNIKYIKN